MSNPAWYAVPTATEVEAYRRATAKPINRKKQDRDFKHHMDGRAYTLGQLIAFAEDRGDETDSEIPKARNPLKFINDFQLAAYRRTCHGPLKASVDDGGLCDVCNSKDDVSRGKLRARIAKVVEAGKMAPNGKRPHFVLRRLATVEG